MQNLRNALFREYQGGVLVYDSHSRNPDEIDDFVQLPKIQITPEKASLLHGCELYGNLLIDRLQYLNMPNYPSTKYIRKDYTLVYPTENTLSFNSKFESGNLAQAIKISENEYNLYLEEDTQTQGYTQWYYFSVKSFKSEHTVKFNILNLAKPHSLYTHGLKPLIFSTKSEQSWVSGGFDISYIQNSIPRKEIQAGGPSTYFTLSFSYTFEYEADRVFFSYSYPYTYTRLQKYLEDLQKNSIYRPFLKISNLCKTLAGNDCPLLTITENVQDYLSEKLMANGQKKQIVVVTARVHPGESNSSFIVKGLVDYLLNSIEEAKSLRSRFVFQIVPMLNPDGVIYGNTRCSLLGVDLNRRWKNPNKLLHPTIFYTKELLQTLKQQGKIFLFCDIHGHSRKKGSFIYACKKIGKNITEQKENISIRLFPLLMANRFQNFNYNCCTFKIEKFKESTARVVVFKEIGVLNSYTLENSFLGLNSDYDQTKLQEIGYLVCNVLWFFRNTGKLERGVNLIYNKIVSQLSDNSLMCVLEAIDKIAPDIVDEVYDQKDFEECDDFEEEALQLRKVGSKSLIKRKKASLPRIRMQAKANMGISSTFIPRVRSVNNDKASSSGAQLKDKRGSFRRIKINLK